MDRSLSRREALGALGLVGVSVMAAGADEPKPKERVTWGEAVLLNPQPIPPKVGDKANFEFTKNGNEFALVFPVLELKLGADGQEQGLHASKVAGFHIPLEIPDTRELTGYAQRVVIGVTKTPGTRVVLFADVGGVTKTVEYPYGKNLNDPLIVIDLPRRLKYGQPGSPAVVPFTATFTLLIQRLTTKEQDNAILSVDALDVAAVFGPFDDFKLPPPKAK